MVMFGLGSYCAAIKTLLVWLSMTFCYACFFPATCFLACKEFCTDVFHVVGMRCCFYCIYCLQMLLAF